MNFDIQTSSQEDKPLLDRNEHKSTQNVTFSLIYILFYLII